jgi:diguanylate cyclase (GGDEF)-like protein
MIHISGTFLKSKIAQRVALILFLAAFIPTALITFLTHNKVDKLSTNHSHEKLVDTSKNYALTTFSNLIFARDRLQIISEMKDATELDNLQRFKEQNKSMFNSLHLLSVQGHLLNHEGDMHHFSNDEYEKIISASAYDIQQDKTKLLVLPANTAHKEPMVMLLLSQVNGTRKTILAAEINPKYLWGNIEDYPSDISVCAYRIVDNINHRLFCSGEEHPTFKDQSQPQNIGNYELFIRGEFQDNPWLFVTKRTYPFSSSTLDGFLISYGYISASVFSLLLVALLSLMQIRRTMVPLEQLIDGTRKISQGEFAQVSVEGKSEFADLATSFNHMSANIKRQLDTLQTLSYIDRQMASNLDVELVIKDIIARTQFLIPSATVHVTRIDEASDNKTQCSITTSEKISLVSPRIAIPNEELGLIRTFVSGHFGECKKDHIFIYTNLLAELGANHYWILPIFWQGEMSAFICVADESELPIESTCWDEISDLAGRIGVAISAQEREDKLLVQAQYDTLTGLPNRILLQDRLRLAIEHSDRSGEPFWLVFVDLDRFKFINDTLGHNAGDQLLVEISKRLEWTIRDTDTVARFGGDEFIIILQGNMEDNLRMGILNRLIEALEAPFTIDGNEVNTTCSAGVAVYPTDAKNADKLLSNADIAMYRAKELGKNNYQFFTQTMNEKVANRLRLETHLRKALQLNELEVYYQPKVSLQTKKIVGMEALVRWNSQALGFIPPLNFIPLAEETGLIIPIGEWVLKTACMQAVSWQKAGYGKLLMAVNLSVRQFGQKNLVNSIVNILKLTGLDAKQLELELTESMLMSDTTETLKILSTLKSIGVNLSIDDFGTGYSSLAYLKNLPVHTLKIDKSFTDEIIIHSNEAPIVNSIISLSKNLKLNVVAEGVENYEQVRYLLAHGCDEIQGYYFSKPATADNIEILLQTEKTLEPPLKLVEKH